MSAPSGCTNKSEPLDQALTPVAEVTKNNGDHRRYKSSLVEPLIHFPSFIQDDLESYLPRVSINSLSLAIGCKPY